MQLRKVGVCVGGERPTRDADADRVGDTADHEGPRRCRARLGKRWTDRQTDRHRGMGMSL